VSSYAIVAPLTSAVAISALPFAGRAHVPGPPAGV